MEGARKPEVKHVRHAQRLRTLFLVRLCDLLASKKKYGYILYIYTRLGSLSYGRSPCSFRNGGKTLARSAKLRFHGEFSFISSSWNGILKRESERKNTCERERERKVDRGEKREMERKNVRESTEVVRASKIDDQTNQDQLLMKTFRLRECEWEKEINSRSTRGELFKFTWDTHVYMCIYIHYRS